MPKKSVKKENSSKTETTPEVAPTQPVQEQAPLKQPEVQTDVQIQASAETPGAESSVRRSVPPNHIFIGKKPVMGYALSTVMQLTQYDTVVLRARGRAISTAVDVAQVATKRLGNGQFVVKDIKIDTEIVGEGAEARNVSTIELVIGKK
jgi:DNA-binding protein